MHLHQPNRQKERCTSYMEQRAWKQEAYRQGYARRDKEEKKRKSI